ncbi:MAG: ATPase [Nitrospirales bacterium]|nr:MAG: ATPase [Nitrospirales bacterium]
MSSFMPLWLTQIRAARRVSVPLIAVTTSDPAHCIRTILASILRNSDQPPPILKWDFVNGILAHNEAGQDALGKGDSTHDPFATIRPQDALSMARQFPQGTILFFQNAHRFIHHEVVAQSMWNLRDQFKQNQRMLILLAPSISIPEELRHDILIVDEPLPTPKDLQEIVCDQYIAADLEAPDPQTLTLAVDAVRGLASFSAEQITAMCLTKKGVDLSRLWDRKRQLIESTPGLTVWGGSERFADIGGVLAIKTFISQLLTGNAPPRSIVFIDEIEKAMAGTSGQAHDTSGIAQAFHGMLLTYMQNTNATGMLFVGPPGTSKSLVAKAAGNEANIPTIALDLGSMKDSLVGSSESNLRQALKVISAVSDDATLFLATCNSLQALSPELRRRFTLGIMYFDLPSAEERSAIWRIYLSQYQLEDSTLPNDNGWTGSEIRQCCDLAWRLRCSVTEAARYIVPIAQSAAEQIKLLRSQANGRFLSANYPGPYRFDDHAVSANEIHSRTITLPD